MKKVINKIKVAENMFNEPGKALNDFSLGFIENYFFLLFLVLALFSALSFWAGFIEHLVFFQITFFFFIILLVAVAVVFYKIKKGIRFLSERFGKGVKSMLSKKEGKVVDIDIEE